MTDGPTGFQVAPITEDEMSKVQAILKRAADAIVGMSQLAADVDMLRTTVASLQADCDRLRNQNNALDEALNHSRSVRDELASKNADLRREVDMAIADRDGFRNQVNDLSFENSKLKSDLDAAKKDRDDHGFRVMELEDALKAAQTKLDAIREGYESIFGEAVPLAAEAAKPAYIPDHTLPAEPSADEAHKQQEPFTPPSQPEAKPVEDNRPWWEKEKDEAYKAPF